MLRVRPATANSLVDCHFFLTRRCEKRGCDYRHNKSCLSTTSVCPKYLVGECSEPDTCSLRHPEICKHDSKPEGCNSASCPYHHLNPCVANGTREPPARRKPPALVLRPRAATAPRVAGGTGPIVPRDPIFSEMLDRIHVLCGLKGLLPHASFEKPFRTAVHNVAQGMRQEFAIFVGQATRSSKAKDNWLKERWERIDRSITGYMDSLHSGRTGRSGVGQPIPRLPTHAVRSTSSGRQRRSSSVTSQPRGPVVPQPQVRESPRAASRAEEQMTTSEMLSLVVKNALNLIPGPGREDEDEGSNEEFESFEHDDSYYT